MCLDRISLPRPFESGVLRSGRHGPSVSSPITGVTLDPMGRCHAHRPANWFSGIRVRPVMRGIRLDPLDRILSGFLDYYRGSPVDSGGWSLFKKTLAWHGKCF